MFLSMEDAQRLEVPSRSENERVQMFKI